MQMEKAGVIINKKRRGDTMSVDKLQSKIRKLKNPTVIDFAVTSDRLPPFLLEQEENFLNAYGRFCCSLMSALKDVVPAVRFSYGVFSLLGADGLLMLRKLVEIAKDHGFYVLVDGVEFPCLASSLVVQTLSAFPADGYICSAYYGTDAITPYVSVNKSDGKSVFVNIRTPNKSASQLQDLVTGSRLVYTAAADIVNRAGESRLGKSGYSQIAGVAAANAPDSLRLLRSKYKSMFLLVDGFDYSNANAKNCSLAFDKFGHGAVVCVGTSVTCAWVDEGADCRNFTESAVRAAERIRKNLTRYVTVL